MNLNTLKTWTFLALLLSNAGMWLATLAGNTVDPHWAVYYSALSAGAYALARGLAKFNADGKPFYQTTEFWIAILGAVASILAELKGTISPGLMTQLLAVVTAASVVADGLRTPPAQAVAKPAASAPPTPPAA